MRRRIGQYFFVLPFLRPPNQVRETKKGKKVRGNGQGTAYKLPNGSYRAVVTFGYIEGKRIQKTKSGFKNKKDALEYIPILRKDIQEKNISLFLKLFKCGKIRITEQSESRNNPPIIRLINAVNPCILETLPISSFLICRNL